ncbi:MAG: hypothetical protein KY460_00150 [Actinobacteria bacterium]|nr:hypothetical protein [Actinomycetota bacterium]
MLPTLAPGDRLVLLRVVGRPRVGHLVVAADPRVPRRLLLKRVHAVAGDRVDVRGDNPSASTDSRTFGPVPVGAVARCIGWRYAPVGRSGYVGATGPISGWRARRDRRRSRRSGRR